jgi:hypothetical protein
MTLEYCGPDAVLKGRIAHADEETDAAFIARIAVTHGVFIASYCKTHWRRIPRAPERPDESMTP